MKSKPETVIHPDYGYRHLDPIPSEVDLKVFYSESYYDLIDSGGRAPELKRLMEGGESAKEEIAWLASTWWLDTHDVLASYLSKSQRRILDFGCGTGHFLRFMADRNWLTKGIEPAKSAAEYARKQFDIQVFSSLNGLRSNHPESRFDAVTLMNVLEHVSNPEFILSEIKTLINDDGLIVVRVPNDFNILQDIAQHELSRDPWWIAYPDHINYFSFNSLSRLLAEFGFEVVDELADFPMEFFLLFGDDYVSEPALGAVCHAKRRRFELALPSEIRRNLYRDFAHRGIGRNCLVFARLVA